jgi:heptosyltransferase I
MTLRFNSPPAHVCLLRLSAIGDTCHALAALRALQAAWPQTRFTWIIGKIEAKLMSALLPEVEFITFDKGATVRELRRLRRELAQRNFELLLHMQLSFRASLVSALVRAPIKLGFDRARARELQWLFTNARIPSRPHEHVLDSLLGFVRECGIEAGVPDWRISCSAAAREYARSIVPDQRPTLLISPCSSRSVRNWPHERYAALARYAATVHCMRVVLVGGPSALEAQMGERIEAAAGVALINQIGKDTLPYLLALIARASVLLTPDSGPAHMASMVATPVIGLYAATNPARSGPYLSLATCVDRYDAACRRYRGKPAGELAWTTKIEEPGVMELIEVEAVERMLDQVMRGDIVR